jgi:hypothetical protein
MRFYSPLSLQGFCVVASTSGGLRRMADIKRGLCLLVIIPGRPSHVSTTQITQSSKSKKKIGTQPLLIL